MLMRGTAAMEGIMAAGVTTLAGGTDIITVAIMAAAGVALVFILDQEWAMDLDRMAVYDAGGLADTVSVGR
ncbi:MAG TPA: hypothetical protein DDY37_01290 [Legionella sp.]|nr:hypothetical protein [Legionella sp.]